MFVSQVKIKNFRCFKGEQDVRLAPVTLLMGENSTGKTSFMAMLRILMDTVHGKPPNFKEAPYDLGTFEEIIYQNGKKGGKPLDTFEASFALTEGQKTINMGVTFGKEKKDSFHPSPIKERMSDEKNNIWLESDRQSKCLRFHTERGTWKSQGVEIPISTAKNKKGQSESQQKLREKNLTDSLSSLFGTSGILRNMFVPPDKMVWDPISQTSFRISSQNFEQMKYLFSTVAEFLIRYRRPYASAPMRSKPKRTYDPAQPSSDPEGEHIPMYLNELSLQKPDKWKALKKRLETFGKQAGLFDEIFIKRFAKTISSPFQILIKKSGGPKRNLIDVGYGVSQILPLVTELFLEPPGKEHANSLFLFQQPEIHLHPSAGAALGSLFCQVAEQKKTQLLIETHDDYLMDRISLDIRDKKTKLKPEDFSILFFERQGQEVNIHSIRIDEEGNILDAPPGYRDFFMKEVDRSLRI